MSEPNLKITVTKTNDSAYIVALQSDISYMEMATYGVFANHDRASEYAEDFALRLSTMTGIPVKRFEYKTIIEEVECLM